MPNRLPTRREAIIELVCCAVFLIVTAAFVGLRPEHILIIVVFNVLFFASLFTRKLAVALIPFALFGISYDWMRIWPNYEVNPIDVQPLYETEKALFGIVSEGVRMIPGEYFNLHHTALADFFAGIFYLCWVPVPIAFGLWLYFKKERRHYLHFAIAFLFVNLLGFCVYYIHPAAPPWYVINYGFEPVIDTPGNVAGLGRFDQLVGVGIFDSLYGRNANVFAAVPSLHASYMLIAFIYAVISRRSLFIKCLFAFITLGIWCTAVYSCHHYIVDVLLGILCALVGIVCLEKGLMQLPPFRRFVDKYVAYIS